MTPTLALSLCLIFILVLFRIDHRKKAEVSTALWVPTLWMLIIGSRMVGQWLNIGPSAESTESYAEGSPLDRAIFFLLIASALIIVIRRQVNVAELVRHNRWLCFFLVYCGISIMWSDFPTVSLKRYVKEIGNILMVIIVLTDNVPIEAIRTLMKRCAYILIPLSIIMYKYYPQFGRAYSSWTGEMSITGVTNGKNSLGVLCAISGLGLAWTLLSNLRTKHWRTKKKAILVQSLMFFMTMWVLVLAHSATSIACFLVGAFILTVTRITAVRKHIALYTIIAIIVLSGMFVSGGLVSMTTHALGRDETFTGRTEIWQTAIAMGTNPIIGGGYSSFWLGDRMEKFWEMYSWHPTEAHNGYLDIYLDLGLIGLALLTGVIVSSFRAVFSMLRTEFDQGALRLAVLIVAVLYNVTESAFRPGLLMYFVFILVITTVVRARQTGVIRGRTVLPWAYVPHPAGERSVPIFPGASLVVSGGLREGPPPPKDTDLG